MAYDLPALRTKILPTIPEALDYLRRAQIKDDRARDVRPLMAALEALPVADPRLDGHITARTAALASFPWRLRAVAGQEERAADAEARLRPVVDDLIERHLDTVLFGQSLVELQWTLEGRWNPSIVQFFDASDIEAMKDTALYPGGIAVLQPERVGFSRMPAQASISDGMATSYVAATHGRKRGGALRIAMLLEVLMSANLRDWSNFNKGLKGLRLGKYRAGAAPEEQQVARDAIAMLGETGGAVVSDDILFEFVRMVDSVGATSFKDYEEKAAAKISILIRGQANVSELPARGGSRAAIQTQRLVDEDVLYMDMLREQKRMTEQVVRTDYELNVNPNSPRQLPWVFEFITEETEDYETNSRVLETLRRAGYKPDIEEVRRKVGWSSLEEAPAPLSTGGLFG